MGIKAQEDRNYKLAETYFRAFINNTQESLHLIEALNQPEFNARRATLYAIIGNAYQELGDNKNALIFFKKAISIAKQENKTSDWLRARSSELGIYEGQQSNNALTVEEATKTLDEVKEVLEVAEKHGVEPLIKQANKLKVFAYANLSTAYFDVGDLKRAEEMAQRAIKLSQEKGIDDGVSLGLSRLVPIYFDQGKVDDAISTSQKMLEIARRNGEPVSKITLLSQIASFYLSIGEINKSTKIFQEALKDFKLIDLEKIPPNLRGNLKQSHLLTLLDLSNAYVLLSDTEKSYQFLAEAIQFAQASSIPSLEVDALLNQAQTITILYGWDNSSVQKAIDLTQRALSLIPSLDLRQDQEKKRLPGREVTALTKLSQLFALQANYPKALDLAQQAAKLAQSKKDLPSIRLALETLAYIYNLQGDLTKLQALVQQYIDLSQKETNLQIRSSSLYGLGNYFRQWGDYSTSEILLTKALEEARKGEWKGWIASIEQGLAWLAWEKGDPKRALELVERTAATAQSENLIARLQHYQTASLAYGELGNNQKAMQSAQAALSITQKIQNRQMEKGVLTLLGNLHRKFGRDAEALTAYESALTIRLSTDPKIEDRNNTAIYAGLAQIYAKRKQPAVAIAFYKQAINNIEDTRRLIKTVDPKLQQSFLQATIDFGKVQRSDVYRQLADLLISQGRVGIAESAGIERLRSHHQSLVVQKSPEELIYRESHRKTRVAKRGMT